MQRLTATIQRLAPGALIYFTTVVMRIPSYNGDFEEPWYWANYGRDLYLYSYYTDQATRFGNTTAQARRDWQANPLAQRLNASRSGRVYVLDAQLFSRLRGPIAEELMVRELQRQWKP